MTMHERHKQWLEGRSLDPTLAEKFGLASVMRDGKCWLSVPYMQDGEPINHKLRLTSEKDHRMDPGAPLALWNADCLRDPKVRSGQAPVVITEGEWDALAVIQSGYPFAVSVPNGAPSSETADLDNAKRYDWVDRHANELREVKEFIIATDDDPAGHYLRSDLVALLGAERCRFIEYPWPSKDLNEVLADHGPDAVFERVTLAKPFPVQGLFTIDDFPERGEVRAFDVGVAPIKDYLYIVPGTLTVVTGYANQGKSTLMNAIIGHALRHHFPVCVAPFETDVKPILRDGLRMSIIGCGKHDMDRHDDLPKADAVLRERLAIISQAVDEDLEMDLAKFLDLCRTAVIRNGVKMIVLDPWNELEHKRRRDESETEYISRALRAIKRFAKQHDVSFWIVAHPAKPIPGAKTVPGLYDISGSANWANKADYGLTYHRPKFDENRAKIIVNKVRQGLPGKRGEVEVMFDFRVSQFVELTD